MIDRKALLGDLQKQVNALEASLRERLGEDKTLQAKARAEYDRAREAQRTGDSWEDWLAERLAQVASSLVLACVFVRFLEDNRLVDTPKIAGPGERLNQARDEETLYFRQHPSHSHRDYLESVLRETAKQPAMDRLLGEEHNPLWTLGPTADGAKGLLEALRRRDAASGALVHDFTDPSWDTRFLGDLYQDLSELARKRYALLQTPEFVEEFILDRTLEPALSEFGLEATMLIDPACGSGHFLIGAFKRLLARWQKKAPGTNVATLAQKALHAVTGVDVNPFAIAIARFRLLVAALRASEIKRLAKAPGFTLHLAAGDSLLHGPRPGDEGARNLYLDGLDPLAHVYEIEDADELRQILGRRYHVVVANPPYITPKDSALNEAYRERFSRSCYRQYSLAVPFKERCFDLALSPEDGASAPAGHIGLITANSFMKREFGKKLIEECFPTWDLTHVVDTSGAYIPGHGTPTVILFARSRRPVAAQVRAVRGIRGEPSTPDDPAHGKVWTAIVNQIDRPGSESEFVSVDDTERAAFEKHPWTLGGGGAAELKEQLEGACSKSLADFVELPIGRAVRIGTDDAFVFSSARKSHSKAPDCEFRRYLTGVDVRDWSASPTDLVWYPYAGDAGKSPMLKELWPWRVYLKNRATFQGVMADAGLRWFDYMQHTASAYATQLSISFAFVATHNHFVLDRGGAVFNKHAPVIKLPSGAGEDDHLALLGLLNSSVACFWMKQVCFPRGGDSTGTKIQSEVWSRRHEFDGTKLQSLPIAHCDRSALLPLTRALEVEAARYLALQPSECLNLWSEDQGRRLSDILASSKAEALKVRNRMAALQEELDWLTYAAYGLLAHIEAVGPGEIEPIDPSFRPFEILMAQAVARGERPSYWYEALCRTPTSEIPGSLGEATHRRFADRLACIRERRDIALIERPEFKRKWEPIHYDERAVHAVRLWLLARLERALSSDSRLRSCAKLADAVRQDGMFLEAAEVYRGKPDFDFTSLVTELVASEAAPAQKANRFSASGLRKRKEWEKTWDLQRVEDRIDARVRLPKDDAGHLTEAEADALKKREVGKIPVPSKYETADYADKTWGLIRGKIDVPQERFIALPGAERDQDPSPVIGWAGWDHLQQAQAIAAYYLDRKEQDGWPTERLTPLLVAIYELVPWVLQWHDAHDPDYGMSLGTYFKGFVDEEARGLGLTTADLDAWMPPERPMKRQRKPKTAAPASKANEPEVAAKPVRKPQKVAPAPTAGDEAMPKKRRTGVKKSS